MFIGHYAVALAAKNAAPKTSLGTLFLASQFVDLVWPLLLLLGMEHVSIDPGNTSFTPLDFYDYPITHSLLAALLWSVLVGGAYFVLRRDVRGATVVAVCVVSHWVLDFLTHGPDLPLGFADGQKVGLGLWNSVAGTLFVEAALFAGGLALYLRGTRAKDRTGTASLWALIIVLVGLYLANTFGPPPPSAEMIAVAGNASWLFVLWAYWTDTHRVCLASQGPQPDN